MTYEEHLEQRRAINARQKERREAAGLCLRCGSGRDTDGRLCLGCRERGKTEQNARKRASKRQAVDHLGGRCMDCGLASEYASVYDFHHRDPGMKTIEVGVLIRQNRPWPVIEAELNKCDLLCANCHRIRHEVEGAEED